MLKKECWLKYKKHSHYFCGCLQLAKDCVSKILGTVPCSAWARKNSTTMDKLVTEARQHLHMLRCRRVAEEQKEKNSNSAGKK
ncbi:hypothetical protein OUZ56_023708 [Daphnia magna]|uniref:Uncharacterized protein n=1 Tax=Daphnia magna TaxID=35525 RepID=A0ABR0AZC2_9CRUS|nr:hypothetical protein OUZ56_023708 [Daphnia magna]